MTSDLPLAAWSSIDGPTFSASVKKVPIFLPLTISVIMSVCLNCPFAITTEQPFSKAHVAALT